MKGEPDQFLRVERSWETRTRQSSGEWKPSGVCRPHRQALANRVVIGPMTMETRCCQKKKKNFKDTRLKISVPLAISTNIKKVSSKLSKKPGKKTPGQMFGQDRPEKNSAKRLIRSGEIPSPRQTSINKTNGFVMNSERGALIRGSDPPSGHSVHNTAGDAWRALARRLIQKHLITGA